MIRALIHALGALLLVAPPARAQDAAERIATYLPYFVRYAAHAETLWHPHGDGAGYWGDGRAGGNGGVRGTSNLTLAHALLVHAEDRGWLTDAQRGHLAGLGLDRAARVARVAASWRYLAAAHATGGGACADGAAWGRSWQSSLWVGASGLAALLVWDDLDDAERDRVRRVVVDEADQKIGVAPRDAQPGNTAAEENGWDTHAPAIALALFPDHAHAPEWLRAAQRLAANTLSVRADHGSAAPLGTDTVGAVVTTANLEDDFTLENHGFFHPSYLVVSVQELGEALAMLELGDRRHAGRLAAQLRPYALHHVADAWGVLRPLLLPDGDFAFPSGSDWAIRLPSRHSCLAFVATALGDPAAALAERRAFTAARWRSRASPPGRILGATNFEWWWEPILLKRWTTAILQLELCAELPAPAADSVLRPALPTWWSEAVGVLVHRTPRYFASVSVHGRPTGLVIPLGADHLEHPYVTTPRFGGLLPAAAVTGVARFQHARGCAVLLEHAGGARSAMVALGDSVVWIADAEPGALGVQNDEVVPGSGRRLRWADGERLVAPRSGGAPIEVAGGWLDVDGQLGLVAPGGLRYAPAADWTRRSAAEDLVTVGAVEGIHVLQVLPRQGAAAAAACADALSVSGAGRRVDVRCRDGAEGPRVRLAIDFAVASLVVPVASLRAGDEDRPDHPLTAAADGDASTFAVLTNDAGVGPTADDPVVVTFARPDAARDATALRLVPRTGYGPRRVRLLVAASDAERWREVAAVDVEDAPVELRLPPGRAAARFRLEVTAGWDRGAPVARPRNTQIAELAFVVPPPGGAAPAAFALERDDG